MVDISWWPTWWFQGTRCPTSSSLAEVAMQVKPIIKSKRNTVILHDLPDQIPLEDIYGHMAMDGSWGRCDCGLSIPVINSKWLLFMNYSWHGVKPPTTDVTIGVLWEREDSHHHVFVSECPLIKPSAPGHCCSKLGQTQYGQPLARGRCVSRRHWDGRD